MADQFTPYWALTLPEVGASRDTWGTKLNGDILDIDTLLQALMPIGAMLDFAGADAPTGWLLCDGTIYTATAYPRLFAVLGGRYGGNGVSSFAVPDSRGRATYGVGATTGDLGSGISFTLGQRAGDWNWFISIANLPATSITTSAAGNHSHGGSVTDLQGDHAHNGGTDIQGDHGHVTTLPNSGTGAAGGGFSVLSDVFGFGNYGTSVNGAHWHNFFTDVRGGHQHNLSLASDGSHQHTFTLGSGTPMRILPPMLAATKIICCGPPSMQTRAADGAAALMMSPMRGGMH